MPCAPVKSWWGRWKPAWLIKLNGGAYRINFDIHRALGLWTWAMMLVFAGSSVAFVYIWWKKRKARLHHTTVSGQRPARGREDFSEVAPSEERP
jgi:uncharacterized iron-regulated membrane protein